MNINTNQNPINNVDSYNNNNTNNIVNNDRVLNEELTNLAKETHNNNRNFKNSSTSLNNFNYKNFNNSNNKDLDILHKESKCDCFNLLIVDDDNLCINYLKNVLKFSKNLKIETANDGKQGVEKIKTLIDNNCTWCTNRQRNIMIFMDIHMPILNGIEAAKEIEKLISNKKYIINCKIIFVSGNVDSQYYELINNIKICKGYYNKPIKKKDIMIILENF